MAEVEAMMRRGEEMGSAEESGEEDVAMAWISRAQIVTVGFLIGSDSDRVRINFKKFSNGRIYGVKCIPKKYLSFRNA